MQKIITKKKTYITFIMLRYMSSSELTLQSNISFNDCLAGTISYILGGRGYIFIVIRIKLKIIYKCYFIKLNVIWHGRTM
jgi:hypothetical protein